VAHVSPEELRALRRDLDQLDAWWGILRAEAETYPRGRLPALLDLRLSLARDLRYAVAQSVARGLRHRKECRAGEQPA
jgi:hypothetical protein